MLDYGPDRVAAKSNLYIRYAYLFISLAGSVSSSQRCGILSAVLAQRRMSNQKFR